MRVKNVILVALFIIILNSATSYASYKTVGEWGSETDLSSSWTWVNFQHEFDDIPVVVHRTEYNYDYDDLPCQTRIDSVNTTGFYIRAEQWGPTSCPGTGVNAYWLAMEKGIYNVSDNGAYRRTVEVMNFTMAASDCAYNGNWVPAGNQRIFSYSWSYMPLVLASVQTANDDDTITYYITGSAQARAYTSSSAWIGLNGMENDGSYPYCTAHTADEEGGYIAWEMDSSWSNSEQIDSSGAIGDRTDSYYWEAFWESDNVRGSQGEAYPLSRYYVTLSQTYSDGAAFASGIRIDGNNGLFPALLFSPPSNRVYLLADEDTYGDKEQAHTPEPFMVLFFNSSSGSLYSDEMDDIPAAITMEWIEPHKNMIFRDGPEIMTNDEENKEITFLDKILDKIWTVFT